MHLFLTFVLAVYSKSFVSDHRFKQALKHTRFNQTLPFNKTQLPDYSCYSTVGWTKPGRYPVSDTDSVWLNQIPTGDYKSNLPTKEYHHQSNNSYDFSYKYYTPIASSFWWGESINISRRIVCITETYQVSLTSPLVSIARKVQTDLNEDTDFIHHELLPPPTSWKTYHKLETNIVFNGSIRGLRSGFFWFKPLYWATFYAGHKITINDSILRSQSFQVTHLYPVSRNNLIEGLFGFETWEGLVKDYIEPIKLSFSPKK